MVNILLCCTGSVATIKVPELLDRLRAHPDTMVRLVVSENSKHFLPPLSSLGLVGDTVLCDEDEWSSWYRGTIQHWSTIALQVTAW